MRFVCLLLCVLVCFGNAAHAEETGTIIAPPALATALPADPSVSLAITCHDNTYNTMGTESGMSTLLDRLQDFCKDQNKDVLPDPGQPQNPLQCINYTVTELNKGERPGRACRQPGGGWNIVR